MWETLTPQELHIAQLAVRRTFEQGNRRQALSVSPNGRLSPAPDFFENRHHLAVRTGSASSPARATPQADRRSVIGLVI